MAVRASSVVVFGRKNKAAGRIIVVLLSSLIQDVAGFHQRPADKWCRGHRHGWECALPESGALSFDRLPVGQAKQIRREPPRLDGFGDDEHDAALTERRGD